MDWGVENLAKDDKAAKAINAGVDIIADTNEVHWIKKAVENGSISEERIDEANIRLLVEMFDLGLFDSKTYVDPEVAKAVVSDKASWNKAYEAHQKSVVILKNKNVFPFKKNAKVYIECLHKDAKMAKHYENDAKEILRNYYGINLADQIEDADVAWYLCILNWELLFCNSWLLELALCENKTNTAVDGSEHQETTISNIDRLFEIERSCQSMEASLWCVNTVMPWLLIPSSLK